MGKARSLKAGIVTGSALAFGVCYLLVPGTGITSTMGLVALGMVLAVFMAGFDIALAKALLKLPWKKVLQDFDPRTGNYLSLGLALLVFFPYVVMRIR
jgi:hypothetical protein